MPQLDQFPLLFQFKSFILGFGFIYLVFLFFVLPVLHGVLRSRKIFWSYVNLLGLVSGLSSIKSNIFLLSSIKLLIFKETKFFNFFENYYSNSIFLTYYNLPKKWIF